MKITTKDEWGVSQTSGCPNSSYNYCFLGGVKLGMHQYSPTGHPVGLDTQSDWVLASHAKAVINVTTNDSSSENSLFDQSLSAPTVLPSTPSNDTDATEENVREQLQTIVDQPLTLDLDEDQESISKITVNGSKRKKAPTKQFHQSKAAKTSVDSLATASSININEAEESNDENHSLQSSAVWKYATRIKIEGKQYAICFDCRAQISTNNWSTSALRRHLIVMHNRLDVCIQNTPAAQPSSNMSRSLRE
ncbi:unnamed protein product, partial [Adineta ricciae]